MIASIEPTAFYRVWQTDVDDNHVWEEPRYFTHSEMLNLMGVNSDTGAVFDGDSMHVTRIGFYTAKCDQCGQLFRDLRGTAMHDHWLHNGHNGKGI